MNEFQGMTAVDTIYELKGLEVAHRFSESLFALLAALVIVIGIVRTLHTAGETRRFRTLIFYLFYAFFMLWLIQPVEVRVELPPSLAIDDLEDIGITYDRLNPSEGEAQEGAQVTTKAPRILVWSHLAIDKVTHLMIDQVNDTFREAPYEVQQVAVLLRTAKIEDSDLRDRYHAFVVSCYVPLVASRRQAGKPQPAKYYNPFAIGDTANRYMEYSVYYPHNLEGEPIDQQGNEIEVSRVFDRSESITRDQFGRVIPTDENGNLLFDKKGNVVDGDGNIVIPAPKKTIVLYTSDRRRAMCDAVAAQLHTDLLGHVQEDQDDLREAVGRVLERTGRIKNFNSGKKNGYGPLDDMVLTYILYNETMGLFSIGEIQRLQNAIPEYDLLDTKQQAISDTDDATPGFWDLALGVPITILSPAAGVAYYGYQSRAYVSTGIRMSDHVDRWISHQAEASALYYKVTCYMPVVYGIAMMIMIAIFPFAGFVSLLPGKWTAIVTWAKYLLWIKLWMVLWAILAAFSEWRTLEYLGDDPGNGMGDPSQAFPAIALSYLLTPALSMVVIQILAVGGRAAASGIGGMAPGMGGASFGAVSGAADAGGKVADFAHGGGSPGAGAGGAEAPPPVA